jgi:mono/diheme cytochrome c family protein
MFSSLHFLRSWSLALLVATIITPAAAQLPGEYRVTQGRVDPGTYAGWRLYHTACYGCHGVDAKGTDLAPNLVERVQRMTPRAFVTKVLTSYRIVLPDDEEKSNASGANRDSQIDEVMRRRRDGAVKIVMPAWEGDAKVNPHVLDLFAYLSARADGKLGPGKPKLRKE